MVVGTGVLDCPQTKMTEGEKRIKKRSLPQSLDAISLDRGSLCKKGEAWDFAIAYTEGIAFVGVDLPDDP